MLVPRSIKNTRIPCDRYVEYFNVKPWGR